MEKKEEQQTFKEFGIQCELLRDVEDDSDKKIYDYCEIINIVRNNFNEYWDMMENDEFEKAKEIQESIIDVVATVACKPQHIWENFHDYFNTATEDEWDMAEYFYDLVGIAIDKDKEKKEKQEEHRKNSLIMRKEGYEYEKIIQLKDTTNSFEKMTVVNLKKICKEKGIRGYSSKLKKSQLIDLLLLKEPLN